MSTSAVQLRRIDPNRAEAEIQGTKNDTPQADQETSARKSLPCFDPHMPEAEMPSAPLPVEDELCVEALIVVGAATVIFTVTLGLVYSFGVSQQLLIQRKFATASELGWVSALALLYLPLFGVPLQMAVSRFGNRAVGLVGTLLTSGAFFSTSFCFQHNLNSGVSSAQRLAPLYIAQSVFGIGYAFMFWSSNSLAAQWVSPRRMGVATGIIYSGSGVGGAVFCIVLSKLAARIGLENSLRIYGAIGFALLLPSSSWLKSRDASQQQRLVMHWKLAKDLKFAFLFIATLLVTFSLFVPPFFLPTYAASAGFSSDVGAWLVAGYNLSSAVGRILFGITADSLLGPVTTLLLCFTLFGATILGVWVTASDGLAPLIVFILINGAAGGALVSLQPAVSAGVWRGSGRGEMQSVMALTTTGRLFGSLLGAPLAGYLLDAFGGAGFGTGAYRPALLVMGFITIAASIFLFGLRWSVVGFSLKKRV